MVATEALNPCLESLDRTIPEMPDDLLRLTLEDLRTRTAELQAETANGWNGTNEDVFSIVNFWTSVLQPLYEQADALAQADQ